MKQYKILIVLFISSFTMAVGQNQITLYQMHNSIPQSNLINPAITPDAKVTVGLPVLSSVYLAFASPLSYNDVFTRGADDSLRFNSNSILGRLKENNKIELDGNVALLFLGFNTKIGFFSLTANSRVDGAFTVPGDLISFALKGTEGGVNDISQISINRLDLSATLFNELGLGYTRNITDNLSVGLRVKYLQGIANATIDGLNGSIQSSIDSINLSMDAWALHTAGLSAIENGQTDYFLFKNSNAGWAFDLGAEYQLNDNIHLSAAVLDMGKITWKQETKSYLFDDVNYTFEGVDFLKFIGTESEQSDVIGQELDSLGNLFDPEEVEGTVYSTPLVGKFYLGGTYAIKDMHYFGLVFAGEVFKSRLTPLVGLTYNIKLGKILNVGINTSYRNKQFGNIGAGLSARFGPIQIYGLADSFSALIFKQQDARLVSFRVGLNIMAGKMDN